MGSMRMENSWCRYAGNCCKLVPSFPLTMPILRQKQFHGVSIAIKGSYWIVGTRVIVFLSLL